tara:strand:+ start:188 stop:352 length:165 start_codon:yes stop_codon:yes gene_type:complete
MKNKIKVSIVEYWDYFWDLFNIEYNDSCKGYADYDAVYRRIKNKVDNELEINCK